MKDIEDFNSIFPEGLGYTESLTKEIRNNQATLGGKTFFERLLELLSIKGPNLYPPSSPNHLKSLHHHITTAPITLHYKHCLVFYLLKDLSPLYHDPSNDPTTELATVFARNVHLEKRFWTFVDGLWELDHLNYETAVGILTHPSIVPTFPDEIMHVLLTRRSNGSQAGSRSHNKSSGGSGTNEADDILPLAYFNCANPPLQSPSVQREWTRYLARRNVPETFSWVRSRPCYDQKALLEVLVKETLEPSSSLSSSSSSSSNFSFSNEGDDPNSPYPPGDRALELVSLPFTPEEEKHIEAFLTEGDGRSLKEARDTVMVRRVAMGRVGGQDDATGAVGGRGKKVDGLSWEMLREGVIRGLGPRV